LLDPGDRDAVSEPTDEANDHRRFGFARRPRRWWPIGCAGAALVIVVSLLLPAGRHQWALSIIRQPARYTALSFRYAWLIPQSGTSGASFPLFFTVTNQEGRAVRYTYIIRQTDQVTTETLSQAGQTVQAGASWLVDTKVRPSCGISPCRVEVVLPGHAETIDFLIDLGAPKAKHKHKSSHAAGASAPAGG
jgi:hypothetical protein